MKNIIITLFALLTFNLVYSQMPVQIVTDPSLLEKAIDQALREAKRMALQEAENELQELQANALTKVSKALKQTGILGDILNKQVELLANAKQFNSSLSSMDISSTSKNNGRTQVKKIVEESDQITKTSKTLMEDEEIKGNDTQRLMLLKQLEQEQKQCEYDLYDLKRRYERSDEFNKTLNGIKH